MSDVIKSAGEVVRADAFDPVARPELFVGVRWRRSMAFVVDVAMVGMLFMIAAIVVFFLGLFTLGLGWMIYFVLWQAVALIYTAFTLGGPSSATSGMRLMGLEMRLWYGAKVYPLLAAVHVILFWLSVSLLTPFVLVVSLVNERKRLLHDILLGTVVVDRATITRQT
jgi:uncharacterized RDD family membrane protein YckC